jgi:hypothetical protein
MLKFWPQPTLKLDPTLPLREKLRKLGIQRFGVLIHEQPKEWLIETFSQGATDYPINVALLFRNIIWQTKELIQKNERPPVTELIRTFWYMYIKPTLSRAGALAQDTDQYIQLVDTFVFMVKDWQVMDYKDIGFRDEKKNNRRVGYNANIIVFSEKAGHQDYLEEIHNQYQVNILALGGQPSVLNIEYFIDDLKAITKIDLRRSFYLFSIVDYDPSGWIIRDALIDDLSRYGINNVQIIDLIHPDALTPEEIALSRYNIRNPAEMKTKNEAWLKEVHKRNYKNQKYLEETSHGETILYGLESESISAKRLNKALEELMVPLIGQNEEAMKIFQLRKLQDAIQALILHKIK